MLAWISTGASSALRDAAVSVRFLRMAATAV
jgi:hypothetical protein